jgi:cysteine-rich repeat protein
MSCTISDTCVAGVCSGDSNTCGDGTVQSGCNEECDDGNVTSNDGCSATCQSEFVCTPAPLVGCRTAAAGKSQLQLKDKAPDTKDQGQWKYSRGAATAKADFGTPLVGTGYQLCIYANGALVSRAAIPASGTCAGKPCWKENAKGFQYKDKDATPEGVTQLKLKEGVAGKSQIQVKLKGANVDTPDLPLALPVRVQIKNSEGVCWETTHSAPASKNDDVQYKDKND